MLKGIGVLANIPISFIDHLVPLSQIMGIPLLCTYPWTYQLIQLYYPEMELILDEGENYCLDRTLEKYDVFYYVDHYRKHDGTFQFAEHYTTKKRRSVYGLHGNSDKQRNVFWIEKFLDEDVSLVYGNHMLDFLSEKGVLEKLKKLIITGNYRLEYYLKHQSHFDSLSGRFFPEKNKKMIFYAPTWSHPSKKWEWRSDYSNFFEVYPDVFNKIPPDFHLLVKLHPFHVFLHPKEMEEIMEKYGSHPQITFIKDFPPIYPLLKHVDCYLGDYSSIGYDFLSFDKPLFFLTNGTRDPISDKGIHLQQCGLRIAPKDLNNIYPLIEKGLQEDRFSGMRKEAYAYAFGEKKPLDLLKNEILQALS